VLDTGEQGGFLLGNGTRLVTGWMRHVCHELRNERNSRLLNRKAEMRGGKNFQAFGGEMMPSH